VGYYQRTPAALERGAYLDRLTLGKPLDQDDAPKCGGDLHRAALPVGAPTFNTGLKDRDAAGKDARAKQNANLRAAIKRALPSLPDIVNVADVLAAVPEAVVASINPSRRFWAVGRALRNIGVQPHVHTGRTRMYVIRNEGKYLGMTSYALSRIKSGAEHKSKIANSKNKLPDAQPPSLPGRSRKSARDVHMERSSAPSA